MIQNTKCYGHQVITWEERWGVDRGEDTTLSRQALDID